VPAGGTATTRSPDGVGVTQILGGANGVVDVYTTDCQPLAVALSVNRLGYTLIRIDATRSVSTTTVDTKDVTGLPGATKVASATCP